MSVFDRPPPSLAFHVSVWDADGVPSPCGVGDSDEGNCASLLEEETVLVAGGRRHRRLCRIVDHLRCHRWSIGMAWEDGEGVGERQGGKR